MIHDGKCNFADGGIPHGPHRWWAGLDTPADGGFVCPGVGRPEHTFLKGQCVAWLHDLAYHPGAIYSMVNDQGFENTFSIDGDERTLVNRLVVVHAWADGSEPAP